MCDSLKSLPRLPFFDILESQRILVDRVSRETYDTLLKVPFLNLHFWSSMREKKFSVSIPYFFFFPIGGNFCAGYDLEELSSLEENLANKIAEILMDQGPMVGNFFLFYHSFLSAKVCRFWYLLTYVAGHRHRGRCRRHRQSASDISFRYRSIPAIEHLSYKSSIIHCRYRTYLLYNLNFLSLLWSGTDKNAAVEASDCRH